MPLWARCGTSAMATSRGSDDSGEGPETDESPKDNVGGGGSFEGLVRNVANLLSDTFLVYFRAPQKPVGPPLPATSVKPPSADESAADADVGLPIEVTGLETPTMSTAESEECSHHDDIIVTLSPIHHSDTEDTSNEDNSVENIDEILSSTLGALYGRATPAIVKQAWEVLSVNYGGDVHKFKAEFLNPVLDLLHKVLEIQDTSDCPNSTWPLSAGSSVVVHLTRKNCKYLRGIGDFCISVDVDAATGRPALVVSDLTFDGVAERPIEEPEFGRLLTMDWARRLREAPDHEMAFVLRQCMVASEYTVRHLRWDEIPQLDPRNLKGPGHLDGCSSSQARGPGESCCADDVGLNTNNSGLSLSAGSCVGGIVNRGFSDGDGSSLTEPATDDSILSRSLQVDSGDEQVFLDTHTDLNCNICTGPIPSPHTATSSESQHSCSEQRSVSVDHSRYPRDSRHLTTSPHGERSIPVSRAHPPTSSTASSSSQHSAHPSSCSQARPPRPDLSHYNTWHGKSKTLSSHRHKESTSGITSHGLHSQQSSQDRQQHGSLSDGSTDGSKVSDGPTLDDRSATDRSSSSYMVRRRLDIPQSVSEVDTDLLCSGVAILPGCKDDDGRDLLYIFTCSSLWHDRRVDSTALARFLLYCYTVSRKRSPGKGLAIVADIRGATTSTINILLEALYLFQDNIEEPVSIVHFFSDKTSQSHVLKSPLYDSKASMNLKVVLTFDHLQQYINIDQIPTVLDGNYPYNHEAWVRFRKKLEPLMASCRSVACSLVDAMQQITSSEQMPQTVAESSEMIQAHEQVVKLAFEDERLLALQSDGPAIISALRREEDSLAHTQDYLFAMEQVSDLHQHLQDSISRLARLADTRMNKLHNCLQLREYEDECHKVIEWLSQDGETILQRHAVTADNLRAVRHQQKDFDKFYYSAMSYIEKGNDLLEEASMLSQCGNFSEATGYKDLAKTLKRQLQVFTGQLEEARERIEGTAKCYHLLDKSYEWALEAMKYVSSMKMEHTATADGLDKLLRSLNIYLSEHPPLGEDSFSSMLDAAQRLHNDKLVEQCRVAKARCQETRELLQLRQTTLRRARNQLQVEQALKEGEAFPGREGTSTSSALESRAIDSISEDITNDYRSLANTSRDTHERLLFSAPSSPAVHGNEFFLKAAGDMQSQSPVWEPQDSSTPTFTNWHGGGDGPRVGRKVGFKSESGPGHRDSGSNGHLGSRDVSGSSPQFHYPTAPPSPYSSASSTASSSGSPTKAATMTSSLSMPLPSSSASSSSPIVPSVTLPLSPTLTTPDPPSRPRLYQPTPSISRLYNSSPTRTAVPSSGSVKLSLGRTISQPRSSVHSLPAGVSPSTRPHKKMLKRASTAPVPMLTSPILEEESPGNTPSPTDPDGHPSREQRSAKSISMITGSSESLPSVTSTSRNVRGSASDVSYSYGMPEEGEDVDLDMSPCRDQQDAAGTSVKDWTPVPVNTHLHRSARSTPTGPMADLRLSEAEIKSRRTVSLIMSEMIQTERDYVRALQFITDHYVPELQRDDVPQMLRGKRTVIFGNLEKIQQFHSQYFLKQLESCQNQPFLVGQYFLQHETMFYLYALYNKNKPKSDTLMMEYGKEFFREKQLELGDKMDLSSYLLKPVQRMGKYALLLKQLVKECAETEPEYPELKAAEEMVKFQLRHGNDLLAMDSLRDCDVNLQEQGRLLRQEEFLVFQGRKKSMRRIFLFEDLILFSKTRRGRQGQHDIYVYKTSFKTADIGMTENYGDSGYKFEIWFRRRSVGENYVLQAPSTEVKKAWVKDISRLLWRQAIRNRETRINELATMGIGNKPCMDIKPSEDNIQDRSINVSLNNRGARTRNSIAVSSFDYLRNGNKRPHSIISVSSTSSSGSSQSSFGLLGSLNLAFDPLDSPRMNRRSFASNESGIVTDSDTSGGDLGTENRGPSLRRGSQGNNAPLSTMRSYFDVMKSRVLKQKYPDQVYTDV